MQEKKPQSQGEDITEKQHFVPKFYLKRFADPQNFLNVLDVKEKKIRSRRPYPGVCYSSFFYGAKTAVVDETSQQIEKWLERIEDWVAKGLPKIIDRILTHQQITEEDKYVLAVLFSMLWIRGPKMRQQINKLQGDMRKGIMRLTAAHAVEQYIGQTGAQWTEEQKRETVRFFEEGKYELEFCNAQHLRFMVDCLGLGDEGFVNLFFAQKWQIYLARGSRRFITSDSPVVEWCLPPQGFYGRAFPEINHYLALTPEILLELTYPVGSSKPRRTTLFADKDDIVMMYNLLIASHGHKFAYSGDSDVFPDMLSGLTAPGKAERLYFDKFELPRRGPGKTT